MPKKLKLMTNMLAADTPVAAAAALAASRLPALSMGASSSSLDPATVNSLPILAVQPTALATAFTASSVSHIMYFRGRRMMAYRGYSTAMGISCQPQPPMGLALFSA